MLNNDRYRGHDFILEKWQSRLYLRKYSFFQVTINESNKLSADCVHFSTINMPLRAHYRAYRGLHLSRNSYICEQAVT